MTHRAIRSTWLGLALLLFAFPVQSAELRATAQLGYMGAPGGAAFVQVSEFATGMPFELRVGGEYQRRDGGNALDARSIFINDNTNGVPEEAARVWGGRMDLVLPFRYAGLPGLHIYGGPRWSSFKANFKYIGGNEDFDVTSEQWGWGMGLEGRYPMGASTDFVLGGGFDWFFDSKLQGHDTSYSPDGEDVNPRNDYEFNDADEAIHQPGFDLRVVIGLQMRLGG